MSRKTTRVPRRRFLKTAPSDRRPRWRPQVIPGTALGKDGAVAPSERIVLGGIGIGTRGTYDLSCFLQQPDVQFVAVCDVKAARRTAVKKMADQKYGNQDCDTYRDFRDLLARDDIDAVLIATGPELARHGRRSTRPGPARTCTARSRARRTSRRAWRWPRRCVARGASSRRARSGGTCRTSPSPASWPAPASSASSRRSTPIPAGMKTKMQRLGPGRARAAQGRGRLGPVPRARRPGGRSTRSSSTDSTSKKAAGWSAAACWNGAPIASTSASGPPMPTTRPRSSTTRRRTAAWSPAMPTASKLVIREDGWLPLGSCPVRFEGDDGLGRGGRQRQVRAQFARLAGRQKGRRDRRLPGHVPRPRFPRLREVAEPAAGQRRRGLLLAHRLPRRQHRHLPRPQARLRPGKNEFIGDEQANRLRREALREPWRI